MYIILSTSYACIHVEYYTIGGVMYDVGFMFVYCWSSCLLQAEGLSPRPPAATDQPSQPQQQQRQPPQPSTSASVSWFDQVHDMHENSVGCLKLPMQSQT